MGSNVDWGLVAIEVVRSMSKTALPTFVLIAVAAVACSKSPDEAKREALQRGDSYVAKHQLREAVIEYRKAIQQDPRFADARRKLADTYVQLGDPANAFREYVRLADLLPDDAEAQLKAGTFLLLAGRFEDAESRANKVLAKSSKNVDAQLVRATALAGLKKFDDAVEQIQSAISGAPDQSAPYTTLGSVQLLRGQQAAAEEAYKKAVETNPSVIQARIALANFYIGVGRAADAEEQLKAALAIDKTNLVANRAIAALYVTTSRAAEAEPYLKTVADSAPNGEGQLLLADYYILTRRVDTARPLLEQLAAASRPTFAPAKLRLASVEADRRNTDGALRLVQEVLAKQPGLPDALILKSRLLFNSKKTEEAFATARAATEAAPDSPQAQFTLGRIQAARGNASEAIAAFSRAVQLNPNFADAELALAELQLAAGRVDEANQLAQSVIKKAPTAPAALMLVARVGLRKGDIPAAERALTTLAAKAPDSVPTLIEMGRLAMAKKDGAAATNYFNQALKKDSVNLDVLAALTTLDLRAGRSEQAITRLDDAVKRSPANSRLLLLAGRAHAASRDTAGAEALLKKAAELDPQQVEAIGWLGELYRTQGNGNEALKQFAALAERQPKSVAPHVLMGTILEGQNRRNEAKDAYKKALAIDAQTGLAANNLAFLYAEDNEHLDEALQLAQTAKARMPDSPDVSDTLGWIYYKKGLFAQAVAALKDAADKRPSAAAFQYHLGLAYAKNGDYRDARRALEGALKQAPQAPEATAAKAALADLATLGL